MPREVITVQVGQCGNQIGHRFWELALREHASVHKPDGGVVEYTDSLASFFENWKGSDVLSSGSAVDSLRARAILIDTEEGVVGASMRSGLGGLFRDGGIVTDVSGAGNNFGHGFAYYGKKYSSQISCAVRKAAERCESLQSFFLVGSAGGGTGSGLGAATLGLLEEQFPDPFRFVSSVFPSLDEGTDVVTAPYNAVLALREISENASCVLPVGNDALAGITGNFLGQSEASKTGKKASFDRMNNVVARCWLDLTASMRFEGSLNVDLNDITTNMIPFPKNKFLVPALAPVQPPQKDVRMHARNIDQLFTDVLSPEAQLLAVDIRQPSICLAQAFLVRGGGVSIAEVGRNVERLGSNAIQSDMKSALVSCGVFRRPYYLTDAFKVGLCGASAFGNQGVGGTSVLGLSNSSGITSMLYKMRERFMKLWRRKAHVHHYTEYIEESSFYEGLEALESLIDAYSEETLGYSTSKENSQPLRLIA